MSLQKYQRSKKHDLNQGSKLLKQVPDEIMELILQRLNLFEYLAFRQECHPWRALSKRCPPAPHLPWLLFNSHPYYIQDQCFVSCLSDPRIHTLDSPMLFLESRCLGLVEGWLIMAALVRRLSPVVNYLLNPITGSRVELPPQSTIPGLQSNRVDFIKKAVASFEQTSLEHCLVACLRATDYHLAFCRPFDESWTLIEAREGNKIHRFTDVEIIDGKLYAVTYSKTLMVFTYTAEMLFELPLMSLPFHLAKDVASKDLFIVYRERIFSNVSFHVMKLECNKGDDPHCVPVYDLGDRTLFLSDLDTKIISSSSSNLSGSVDNRLKNCIYYSLRSGRKFGVFSLFSLTNKSIKLLTPPGYVSPFAEQRFSKESFVWFKPNPW